VSIRQFDLSSGNLSVTQPSLLRASRHFLGLISVRAAWAENQTSNSRDAKTQIPEMRLLQSQHAVTVGPQT
jgi:hypothetical protein